MSLDDWLDELTELVADALDIEASLRDVQLPERVEALGAALEPAVDAEAGLRAILAATIDRSDAGTWIDQLILRLDGLSPRERLELRSRTSQRRLLLLDILVEASEACGRVIEARIALMNARARGTESDFAQRIAIAFSAVRLARRVSDCLSREPATEFPSLAGDARALTYDFSFDRSRRLASDLYFAMLALGQGAVRTIAGIPDESLVTAPDNVQVLFAGAMRMFVAAVTDFTDADLADLDLRGIDLRGVRWSALTTRWPPEWENTIRDASVQIDPEHRPDLFEVLGNDPRIRHTVQ